MTLRCTTCGYTNQLVDDTTAFCPNCGSAYVPPTASPLAVGAGVTPWQTASAGEIYPAGPPPMPEPTVAAMRPMTPPFAPPQTPPSQRSDYATPTPPRQRRLSGIVLGALITFVVVLLGAGGYVAYALAVGNGGSTVATVATATATPFGRGVRFRAYTDPTGAFSIDYPTTWQYSTTAQGGTTVFSPADGVATFLSVTVGGSSLTLSAAATTIDQRYVTTVTVTSGPNQVGVSGITWQAERGYFVKNGKTIIAWLLVTQQQGRAYLVVATGTAGLFEREVLSIYTPMLKSLSFGTA